jgi:hypothetical protein
MFNGIDASNPTHLFSPAEWEQIGQAGRTYVMQERVKQRTGRGRFARGDGAGQGFDGRGRGRGCMINEVIVPYDGQTVADSMTMNLRGGRSGAGFGRAGAHMSQGGNTGPTGPT